MCKAYQLEILPNVLKIFLNLELGRKKRWPFTHSTSLSLDIFIIPPFPTKSINTELGTLTPTYIHIHTHALLHMCNII